VFLLLAADDLHWLPCAGPGLHGHLDLTYHQYLQKPVISGQHLLADHLTDTVSTEKISTAKETKGIFRFTCEKDKVNMMFIF
jgi:hypothetical protein